MIGDPEKMVIARKYVLAILCIFCTASGLIKISILLFYRRLSSRVVSVRFRLLTWLTIGFITAYTIALTLAPIFGCNPISAFWDQANSIKLIKGYKYHCFDEGADVFSASVISAVQDLITAILPTFLYWNLRVPIRQKIALFGIFAIGYGVAALGAMRAYYSWQIYYGTYDVTWSSWNLFIVTMLELHVGCFCANAPTLKVFFKHFFHEKLGSSAKRSTGSEKKVQKSSELPGTQSSKSSAGTFKDKISTFFSKGNSTYSRDGYLSGPHANVTVDAHGGVQVQKELHVSLSPTLSIRGQPAQRSLRESVDTMEMICSQYYYGDIELGRFTTSRNSQVSSQHSQRTPEDADIEALPAIPQATRSPRSMKSFMSFQCWSRSPQLSTHSEWPSWPSPAVIAEERNEGGTRSRFCTPDGNHQKKPQWQTWT